VPTTPTIKDIAARAGVSISTVHYALRRTRPISDETRDRVLAAVRELDYQPHAGAATLPSGRTGRLAVVIAGIDPAFANTYFSDFIRGLAAAAEEEDHTVVLYTAYGRKAAAGWRPAHVLRRREADGLLLLGTQLDDEHLAEVAELGQPCVLLNREHPHLPWIAADRRQGARLATSHLLAHGRPRLGLLAAAYRGGAPADERPELAGFRDALRAAGQRPESGLVRFVPVHDDAEAATAELLRGLLAAPSYSSSPAADSDVGLLVFSYTLAPAAARAVSRSGARVPDDLALVVGDEDPDARESLAVGRARRGLRPLPRARGRLGRARVARRAGDGGDGAKVRNGAGGRAPAAQAGARRTGAR
jgi:DNA-binding LacI/PurR family transcriptional regulator